MNRIFVFSIAGALILLGILATVYFKLSSPPSKPGAESDNVIALLGYKPGMDYDKAVELAGTQKEEKLISGYEKGLNNHGTSGGRNRAAWKTLLIEPNDESVKALEKVMTLPCDSMRITFTKNDRLMFYELVFDSGRHGRDLVEQHMALRHDISGWAPDAVDFLPETDTAEKSTFGIKLNEGNNNHMKIWLETDKPSGVSTIYLHP